MSLTCNVCSHDFSVEFGTLNLENIDLNIFVGNLLEFLAKFLDILATLTYHQTGARSAHGYGDELEGALNHDAAHAAFGQTDIQDYLQHNIRIGVYFDSSESIESNQISGSSEKGAHHTYCREK